MKTNSTFRQPQVPRIVGVGGFTSEVGKTTLLCELLRAFPGWEAIKITRGQSRSHAKDLQRCGGRLLRDEPVVCSGRDQNYLAGKDTGRLWDAGAANVHWVIATDSQLERGTRLALERVRAPGVIIEGNSFLRFMDADFFVMVARAEGGPIKPAARRTLERADALFLSGDLDGAEARKRFAAWRENPENHTPAFRLRVYCRDDLRLLITRMRKRFRS